MNTIITLSVLGIISMLSDILGYKKFILPIVIGGLLVAACSTVAAWNVPQQYFNMMQFDNYAVAFSTLIIVILILWVALSNQQYATEFNRADQYALILFSTVGAIVLVSFHSLVMLFVGIEVLSIPLYILAGSRKTDLSSNEASLKYFMMGAFTTGILLFGITLIYGATGSFDISIIQTYVANMEGDVTPMFYTGVIFLLIALSFKISAVPFHFWAPDVYQGAPTMITTFMATIVKIAAFGAFYRLFSICFANIMDNWTFILSIVIVLTIVVGNILAVRQTNVKRMLAYSGISQAGYMLMTLLVLNNESTNALLFYAGSYALSTIVAFTIFNVVHHLTGDEGFDGFNALGKRQPLLALIMTIAMLSLAGIPPAVGFFAKFYLFETVLSQGNTFLVIIAVLGSIVSVYYYFKLIIAMYVKETTAVIPIKVNTLFQAILIVITGVILILGINPSLFLEIIR